MSDPTGIAPPSDSPQSSYRFGYRTGFGDGFDAAKEAGAADAKRDHEKKPSAEKKPEGDQPADGKKPDDKKSDGEESDGEESDNKEGNDKKGDGKPPLYKRPVVVLIVIVVVLALIIGGVLFWRQSRRHESTDDAFVDGRASQMAAQVAGRVTKLYVTDNQTVKAGDPLLEIDASDVQARLDQARAQTLQAESQAAQAEAQLEGQRANALQAQAAVRQAEAETNNAAQDLARFRGVDPDAVSRQQYDSAFANARSARARLDAQRSAAAAASAQVRAAQAQVRVAQANVETSRASGASAELQLSYTHVVAPTDGRVTRRSVEVGNVISVGQALLAIVGNDLWVTANYKETQLTEMRIGQPVEVQVDAFPDVKFAAHVDSIQRGTGSYFSMLPAENATGNYVKVVQRVPVKIVFDRPEELRNFAIGPGMSVVPDVRLR
jgi:membrane fusion protein, multidrug efflux system